MGRLQEIINKIFFEKNVVDTVFVFGGTNDSWAASPVGDLMYNDWQEKDFYSVLPAICYIFHQLKVVGKKLRIVCIINTELKTNITEGFIKACQYYDVDCIELKSIDKINDHPSALGMEQIKKQILEYFS